MSSVPKLGNNRYLATSKGVNRMLNQLNGILAADNITVQNVPATSQTISLAAGNIINITMPTYGSATGTTYTFTDKNPGIYYLLFTTPNSNNNAITLTGVKKATGILWNAGTSMINLITIVCDGTNMYEVSRSLSLT
jgi:hypothetical protein